MGLGLFALIIAAVVFASFQYEVDRKYINDDYERWKNDLK